MTLEEAAASIAADPEFARETERLMVRTFDQIARMRAALGHEPTNIEAHCMLERDTPELCDAIDESFKAAVAERLGREPTEGELEKVAGMLDAFLNRAGEAALMPKVLS